MGEERKPGMRNVIILGLVSFFNDVSAEMVMSVFPVFVTEVLKASLGALGLIEGVAEALSYGLRLLSGIISDIIRRRKPLVAIGYSISVCSRVILAAASRWWHALVARGVDRVGKGVRTAPRDALLAGSVPEAQAGKAFGIHRALDQSGAVVGPLLASALLPILGFRGLFLASVIPGALAVTLIIAFVHEVRVERREERLALLSALPYIRGYLVAILPLALATFSYTFILVYARRCGLSEAAVPLIYVVISIFHVLAAIPAGLLSDLLGPGPALSVTSMLLVLTDLLMARLAPGLLAAIVVAASYGVFQGSFESLVRATVAKLAPEEVRGTAYGLLYLTLGAGLFGANLAFGRLWDAIGLAAACLYSASLSTIAAIALPLALKSRAHTHP